MSPDVIGFERVAILSQSDLLLSHSRLVLLLLLILTSSFIQPH